MSEQADVIVIGMGVGGEAAAGQLAEAGLSVIGIERELVGGECPYWGCVPSKMGVRAANLLQEARRIDGMAGSAEVRPDWGPVAQRIREEATDDWDDQVAADRFEGKGGTLLRGEGRIIAAGTVRVTSPEGERELTASTAIVVASGTTAAIPPIPGLSDVGYWTNREALEAKELPSSLIVLGGGAIGVELGQVFARFGCQVAIVEALDRLLPLEEPEAGALLAEALEAEGIGVHVGVRAEEVSEDGDGIKVRLQGGGVLHAERVLVATGRRPDPAAVGLDNVGVAADARVAPVDEHLRVAPGVWAIGDITGKGAFTHVAVYQANIVVADILGRPHEPADYRALPRVTFSDPEVGSVGMTEAQAREAGINVRIATSRVPSSARGWMHKAGNDGVTKLVIDADRDVLVGATTAGPHGGEVLGLPALAIHAEIPVATLKTMIYAYPTFHRGIGDALNEMG